MLPSSTVEEYTSREKEGDTVAAATTDEKLELSSEITTDDYPCNEGLVFFKSKQLDDPFIIRELIGYV